MMDCGKRMRRFCDRITIPGTRLFGCWIAGSLLGLTAAFFPGNFYTPLFRVLPGCMPTPGGTAVTVFLPLLISACAVYLFRYTACYCCCFVRSFGQGIFLGALASVYGRASMLMAVLLLFSGLCVNCVMLAYWLRRIRFGAAGYFRDTAVCFCVCALIGALDYGVIAPFLADVINL